MSRLRGQEQPPKELRAADSLGLETGHVTDGSAHTHAHRSSTCTWPGRRILAAGTKQDTVEPGQVITRHLGCGSGAPAGAERARH